MVHLWHCKAHWLHSSCCYISTPAVIFPLLYFSPTIVQHENVIFSVDWDKDLAVKATSTRRVAEGLISGLQISLTHFMSESHGCTLRAIAESRCEVYGRFGLLWLHHIHSLPQTLINGSFRHTGTLMAPTAYILPRDWTSKVRKYITDARPMAGM